jgi:hypothetical protein
MFSSNHLPPKSPSRAAQQWAVSLFRTRTAFAASIHEHKTKAGIAPAFCLPSFGPGRGPYIIPPMSGMPAPAPAGVFSGGSATIASVVRMFFAIEAAF